MGNNEDYFHKKGRTILTTAYSDQCNIEKSVASLILKTPKNIKTNIDFACCDKMCG